MYMEEARETQWRNSRRPAGVPGVACGSALYGMDFMKLKVAKVLSIDIKTIKQCRIRMRPGIRSRPTHCKA